MTSRVVGTFSVDGSSPEITSTDSPILLSGAGTFGGGSIAVEMKLPDGTWQVLNAATIEAVAAPGNAVTKLDFPANFDLRATLTGATTPNIDYILQA